MFELKRRRPWLLIAAIIALMPLVGFTAEHGTAVAARTWQTQISTGGLLGPTYNPRWFYVTSNGGDWQPTYLDTSLEGRLMNFRAANALFDDDNRLDDNPEANTAAFISNFDAYKAHGVLAMTVGLQGGNPGYNGELVSAFNPDGSLKTAWMERTSRVIEAADARGMIIILSYFYVRQDQILVDETALKQAIMNATDWLIANEYRNVIIEIANEYPLVGFDHAIIRNNTVSGGIGELINLAKSRFNGKDWRLPVSAARDGIQFKDGAKATADLAIVHGNGYRDWEGTLDTYAALKRIYDNSAVPVVMNEDNNGTSPGTTTLANDIHAMEDAIRAGGSWGLMWKPYMNYPFRWHLGPSNQLTTEDGYFHAILDALQAKTASGPQPSEPSTPTPTPLVPPTASPTASATPTPTPLVPPTASPTASATPTPTPLVPPTANLLVSLSANRSNPVPLHGQTVSGDIYVFTAPGTTDISRVRFFLDDPGMTRRPRQTESSAPYDFAGGTISNASPFKTATVADGAHTITSAIDFSGGGSAVIHANVTVANSTPDPDPVPTDPIDQVHLAWVSEPSTTLTVVWRTVATGSPSTVEYRAVGSSTWRTATGAPRPSGTAGTLHEVTISSLIPSTEYEYRVLGGDGSTWSSVFSTRTAPPAGPADFDAIYVADTGLVGRTDGLATGTQQVIDEIAALNPDVVLPGGDFAYFDTDKRYGTLNNTIDAWFNQMQPIGARSPLMPAYGNHEVLLGEGFDAWASRFPTPDGFDSRRNYSFDVGDVHFISIFAVQNAAGLPSAQMTWIEQDITAAKSAGQRWVIPYFHVSPFSDGTNHPSNLQLRSQLGPLFERHDVKLVLTSHDQSYERTFPLTDVPATNTPTSTSTTCYTMNDGVTWVKTSPGGKLSNINEGFSTFATNPPPHWTAVRDNTLHHFSRLVVSAAGTIRLDTYGVKGDGTPPIIIDSFEYTTGSCSPALEFDPGGLSFTVPADGSTSQTVTLATNNATVAPFTATDDAQWLTATPATGSTPSGLRITADATGLSAGFYQGSVTASSPGFASAILAVTLTVSGGDGFDLLVSKSSTRSSPALLQGQTVSGNIYVFTSPDTADISRVRFYLDDPGMTGSPRQTELSAPYDFASGSTSTAKAFNTATLSTGAHNITAAIDLKSGGSVVLHADFRTAN